MTLIRKLVLAITAGILAVHVASATYRVTREIRLFERDIVRDELVLGHALAIAVERTWSESGEAAALDLVAHANARESDVEIDLVFLDDGDLAGDLEVARVTKLDRASRTIVRRTETAFETYARVDLPGGRRAAVRIVDEVEEERQYVWGSILVTMASTGSLILLCGLVVWMIGSALIGRPIRELVAQARQIGAGDLSSRVPVRQKDEIGELSLEMNRMADALAAARERAVHETRRRLAAVAQLRHADRLTTVGTLAAGIAHELGTPINVIGGYAELVLEDPLSARAHDSARAIGHQAQRITGIVRQLLDFARRGDGVAEDGPPSCDGAEVLASTLALLDALTRKRGAEVVTAIDATMPPLAIFASELQQVVTNLVVNAVHAMPQGGTVRIELAEAEGTRPGKERAEKLARVVVEDTGCGIPPAVLERIFEPFFTTKEVGEGTGLGLAVAWGIVNDRGGWIDVQSQEGRGTCFTVWLPTRTRPSAS